MILHRSRAALKVTRRALMHGNNIKWSPLLGSTGRPWLPWTHSYVRAMTSLVCLLLSCSHLLSCPDPEPGQRQFAASGLAK